ncbi:protein of unknown function [Sphingomonas rubra]|uniref:DUF4403 family protein n=1 Tax=Sphingomonas rubra TaxID=634430 RepID=A0A1I5QFS8_9SPHN|nr:DUF4403 family protein [Sphingomonas rubra]SFP44987.1 protein of unknown function [Sphingomonas rubra]
MSKGFDKRRHGNPARWALPVGIGVVLCLSSGACSRGGGNAAPPREDHPVSFPRQTSTIVVPVTASLSSVAAVLDAELPRRLWTIDERKPDCVAAKRVDLGIAKLKVLPKLGCRIVGQVTRGRVRLSGRGNELVITLPVNATISARKVGGIASETATGAATVRAVAHLSVASDWSPRAKVDIDYDWTTPPGIDILGQRIEFVGMADKRLQPVIVDLERTLPRELAKLKLRDQLAVAWRQGFTSVALNRDNPPAWMRLEPRRLGFGGYRVTSDRIEMVLAADAITETFIGPRPADPAPAPLPPPSRHVGTRGLHFFIPVLADYAQLEPVIGRALRKLAAKGITLPGVGPVDAEFGRVTVFATTGDHLAVGVQAKVRKRGSTTFATKGTVWLTAIPYNDRDSQVVRVRDVRIAGDTDSGVANLLLTLFGDSGVQDSVRQALTHDFGKDFARLLGDVRQEIGQRREGDFVFFTTIDRVRNGGIVVTGDGLFLPVDASGTATIAYRPRGKS